VLDPACGSGGFPVSAYHRKRSLLPKPAGSHERLLSEIYGIDINRFPAHLTAINLAIQDLSSHTEDVGVEVADFFNVNADTQRFGRTQAGAGGEEWVSGNVEDAIGGFDVVVGNPPYIKQQNIQNRAQVRDHLSRVDGEHLSKMSDIYSYFITHSTEFLADGGRLGLITSDRWLDTRYGEDLQQFVLDNFTVDAVIKFNRQIFEDALVGSCVVVLTKEEDSTVRNEHVAKFLRVNESLDIDEITSVIGDEYEPDQMIRREDLRLVTRKQRTLYEETKWNVFFNAPPIYFDILGQDDTVELSDRTEIKRGITSGANDFYYGRTEEWEQLGLDEYVRPLLKASGQVSKIEFDEAAAEEWAYLSIHDLVEKALAEADDEYSDRESGEKVKEWLTENGHISLVEYIRYFPIVTQ
jgi:type I restriction-modification system DNA methylase subunit